MLMYSLQEFPLTNLFPRVEAKRALLVGGQAGKCGYPSMSLSQEDGRFLFPVKEAGASRGFNFGGLQLTSLTSTVKGVRTWESIAKDGKPQKGCYGMHLLKSGRHIDISCSMGVGPSEEDSATSADGIRSSSDQVADEIQFLEAAQKGNLVPLFKTIHPCVNGLTPSMAYEFLIKKGMPESQSFLFDNTEQEKPSNQGLFSSLGAQPAIEIMVTGNNLVLLNHEVGSREERVVKDPMNEPDRVASTWKPVMVNGLPNTFCGGWVGHFSYHRVGSREDSEERQPLESPPDLPGIHLGLYKDVIVFDHTTKLVYAIHWVQLDQFKQVQEAYNDGNLRLKLLADLF